MLKYTVDLSAITDLDEFEVENRFMTVQIRYKDIDGDFRVGVLQSLDGTNFNEVKDFMGNPVIERVAKKGGASLDSGSRTFNVDASLYTVKAKLAVQAGGRLGASEGEVELLVLNSDSVTTTSDE